MSEENIREMSPEASPKTNTTVSISQQAEDLDPTYALNPDENEPTAETPQRKSWGKWLLLLAIITLISGATVEYNLNPTDGKVATMWAAWNQAAEDDRSEAKKTKPEVDEVPVAEAPAAEPDVVEAPVAEASPADPEEEVPATDTAALASADTTALTPADTAAVTSTGIAPLTTTVATADAPKLEVPADEHEQEPEVEVTSGTKPVEPSEATPEVLSPPAELLVSKNRGDSFRLDREMTKFDESDKVIKFEYREAKNFPASNISRVHIYVNIDTQHEGTHPYEIIRQDLGVMDGEATLIISVGINKTLLEGVDLNNNEAVDNAVLPTLNGWSKTAKATKFFFLKKKNDPKP